MVMTISTCRRHNFHALTWDPRPAEMRRPLVCYMTDIMSGDYDRFFRMIGIFKTMIPG